MNVWVAALQRAPPFRNALPPPRLLIAMNSSRPSYLSLDISISPVARLLSECIN